MPRRESPPPPEFLVDRSLGAVIIPAALRDAGYVVHTLRSVYGEAGAQEVEDRDWLIEAGARGWIVLAKDERIRRRPAELEAIASAQVKAFYLTAGGVTGEQQARILLAHIHRIIQRASKRGPMVWAVSESGLRRVV